MLIYAASFFRPFAIRLHSLLCCFHASFWHSREQYRATWHAWHFFV